MRALLLAGLCFSVLAAVGQMRTTITLAWDYPPDEITGDCVFKVYASTNATAVVSNWPLVAVVAGTNRSVTLPILPQQQWFVVTFSNWWGESTPSNVAGTPPLPSDTHALRIGP